MAGCDGAVLAISGGLDSMVLLTAAAKLGSHSRRKITVATFDHGTGRAAGRAAALVARHAYRSGFVCVNGRAATVGKREEEWRRARWQFLEQIAASRRANVFTAHTLDDQIETVFMRILRDAGPRGLAGLYAESEIVRPFLNVSRATLTEYDQHIADVFRRLQQQHRDEFKALVERANARIEAVVAKYPKGKRGK